MKEYEIRNLIRESAEDVAVPAGLEPERIKDVLLQKEQKSAKKSSHRSFYVGYAASAAAFVAICGLALFGGRQYKGTEDILLTEDGGEKVEAALTGDVEGTNGTGIVSGEQEPGISLDQEWQELLALAAAPKTDAGEVYRVASDYGEVYDSIVKTDTKYFYDDYFFVTDGMVVEEVEAERTAPAADLATGATASVNSKEFSTTNLQTEGVDESDIIKTDGEYLYIVKGSKVHILDIRGGEPKEAVVVSLPLGSASVSVKEIYVDDGELIVIAQERLTQLKEMDGNKQFYTDSQDRVACYTYDIGKPEKPILQGAVSQDGYYHTSRKIGDKVYLFTNESIGEACYRLDKEDEGWIPVVNDTRIAYDCIYIPEQGYTGLIISSIDTDHPDQVLDNVMIVNNSANVYVSTKAIYLYHTEYHQNVTTEIAKFNMQDGIFVACGATNVSGRVTDTFAVNEKDGMLRILTNEDYTNQGSTLYILDEKLGQLGVLGGIAPGEDVYAARYLGDMAYFVTYRNIDPLFAADLSDPTHPVILGELKITGYSEYLHMWEDGTMLGIGYETDPDSGSRKGVKLSMFDVSDPANLKVKDSICITDADYSPAMSYYKTVLADPGANLMGFVVTEYNKGQENTYLLFEYRDGKFHNLLTEQIGQAAESYRGIYVGEYFYIVSQGEVLTFARTDNYEKLGKMSLAN